uniref:Lectin/glucanase superfamily protein n=1 Tax=viral metagenome TaxID=1070528 RepID=A0A6C0DTJ5_9ZZZZ
MYQLYLWIGVIILITVTVIELWKPEIINEGFASLVSVGDTAFWAKWLPRRGDVGLNATEEQGGYIRDIRYFAGYTDVQRLGVNHDFCRMVQAEGDADDKFFACALGGTEGLSTVKYRTPSVRQGFELSRDDYMHDVLNEGRDGYCRILKTGTDTFEAQCNPAGDTSFSSSMITDANPPEDIKLLLTFYEGIVFWLRLRDDMLDYAKNLTIAKAGGMEIQEAPPNPPVTEGLEFNGNDQFLRIGDAKDLSFGEVVQLRYLRATCFWVYFDEFTNNAHIYDFGNGAGKDNVFVGIMGRGNAGPQSDELLKPVCLDQAITTVPSAPSGQQCVEEMSPERSMITSSANVNLWQCPKPELFGKIMKPLEPKAAPPGEAKTADLIYEIWEGQMRKLHIQVKNVIPLRKWVHIAITAGDNDAWKPSLKIYRNGSVVHTEGAAWLPQTNYTTNNYIGKSNWSNMTSPYENADKLFKGKMFDFRGYRIAMDEKKVKDTYKWGKNLLGLEQDEA